MSLLPIIVTLIILLALIVGAVLLQIYLSRKENRWPGLFLPGLSFLLALTASLSNTVVLPDSTAGETALSLLVPFLYLNIPTYIFIAIYIACRESRKRAAKAQMDKMNIQDLD